MAKHRGEVAAEKIGSVLGSRDAEHSGEEKVEPSVARGGEGRDELKSAIAGEKGGAEDRSRFCIYEQLASKNFGLYNERPRADPNASDNSSTEKAKIATTRSPNVYYAAPSHELQDAQIAEGEDGV